MDYEQPSKPCGKTVFQLMAFAFVSPYHRQNRGIPKGKNKHL